MSDTPPTATAGLEATLTTLAANLGEERAERQRGNRVLVAVGVLGAILLAGILFVVIAQRADITRRSHNATRQRAEQLKVSKDIKTLVIQLKAVADDTHRVAVQFNCAIELQRAHPEFAEPGQQPGELDAFDACVAEHLAAPAP